MVVELEEQEVEEEPVESVDLEEEAEDAEGEEDLEPLPLLLKPPPYGVKSRLS